MHTVIILVELENYPPSIRLVIMTIKEDNKGSYFVTYGNNLLGCYSIIEEPDFKKARKLAYEATDGGKYAFFYSIADLKTQLKRNFVTKEIPLQPMDIV